MKRVSKVLPLTLALALVALLLVGATGCTCKKPIEEVPPPPPPPPKVCAIDAIDANPWTINVGQSSSLSVRGTPSSGPVTALLTCIEGSALGTTKSMTLTESTSGVYTGTATADATLPPCKYRVEAEMACPGGAPVKLVSSRALVVNAPAPPPAPTACMQFMEELQRDAKNPKILFNFDKALITSANAEYIKYVAGKLASFKGDIDMVLIEGHTDPFGTTEYNLNLGAERARATLDATQAAADLSGVNFETKSWGEEQLLVIVPSTVKTQKAIDENQPNRRAVYTLQCRAK